MTARQPQNEPSPESSSGQPSERPAVDDISASRRSATSGVAEGPTPFLGAEDLTASKSGGQRIGPEVIKDVLHTLDGSPGVYRMMAANGDVLYVGKAKNLKKRVASYTRPERLSIRIARVVAATAAMEVVTTHTEAEALLLENNLIKQFKPRYNVLLRDDKSFPYILITGDTEWPRIMKYRGAQNLPGEYFGPFASALAVAQTLAALERAFPLRSCSDTVFSTRSRPCLQYQIKRCTAPCVLRITKEDYDGIVNQTRDFLEGRSHDVQKRLSEQMQKASEALDYEQAAMLRDRIRALTQIQARQDINMPGIGEADVLGLHIDNGQVAIQTFFFRAGQNLGNRSYFPSQTANMAPDEILEAFLGQFYASHPPPPLVLLSHAIGNTEVMAEALALRAGRKVTIEVPQRGDKRKLVDHAVKNAGAALSRRMAESASQRRLLEGLAEIFDLDAPPERIEVYDNSHISGTNAVGAMIVAGPEGLIKNAYRKFNIRTAMPTGPAARLPPTAASDTAAAAPDVPPAVIPAAPDAATRGGDDYAMLREVLTRRFARALKEDPERTGDQWPDLVLIDGGAGQLSIACEVFADLGINDIPLAAIAKGPDRNAGRERFFVPRKEPFSLDPQHPVLYFMQRLRDEAHRFAIGSHRTRRAQAIGRSLLDEIPGIGAARKKALLHHFGSARGVAEAGVADLEVVRGISRQVAQRIYDHFHGGR
jgi:excinuclease ABC subunit C